MVKLAIHGKAKTGKDTVAKMMEDIINIKYKKSVLVTAFANPIKHILSEIFDHDLNMIKCLTGESSLRNEKVLRSNKTYRQLLIEFSDLITAFDPDIWIKKTFKLINAYNFEISIISDVRFKKEFVACKNAGYKIIKLTRPNNDYYLNVLSETDLDEISNDSFDYHVVNDGTIRGLEDKVREILTSEMTEK